MPFDPTLPPRAAPDSTMGATPSEPDALATPFDSVMGVDLLLSDIHEWSQPAASPAERTAHRIAMAAGRSGGKRPVLVVDRSPIARKFLVQRLRALGYTAHGAQDGEEALEMIEQREFAIVFSEVSLGQRGALDGLRLCQAIKQKPDHRSGFAPVVVLVTGLRGASDRVRGTLAGCDAYLTKPLTESEFVAALVEVDPLFS